MLVITTDFDVPTDTAANSIGRLCTPVATKAVVTTTVRLRFDRRSTPIRQQIERATTIRRPTLRPHLVVVCCTAAEINK